MNTAGSPYILFGIGAILALGIQLLLCFKVKYTLIKLIPVILLAVSAVAWYIKAESLDVWEGFAYGVLSAFAFAWLVVCTAGWVIWTAVTFINKKKQS